MKIPLPVYLFGLMLTFQVQALDLVVDESQVIHITQALPSIITDSDALLTPNQHKRFSTKSFPQSIQPGKQGSWYKVRLNAKFINKQPQRRTIAIDSHIIRHLHFYLYDEGTLIKSEQLGITDENNIIHHTDISEYQSPYFQFYIQNDQPLTLLIYKQNDGPSILPMTIYNDEGLKQKERVINFFWGGIICVLLVMALYNVIVYSMHPNKAYLWYMGFHSLMIFYFGGLNGYGYLIFPLEMQLFLSQNIMVMNFLVIFFITNFTYIFLDIEVNAQKLSRFFKPLSYISLLGAATSFVVPEYTMIPLFSIIQLFGTVFGITAAVTAYRNNYKPAKYFLMSWIFTLTGGAIGMGTVLGLLPINFFTLHGFLFGTLSELFLFSVALAHRMKSIETDMLSQSYIYPDTNIGNFTYLKGILPDLMPSIQTKHEQIILIVAEIYGLKELVSLYGPQALSDFYRNQTGLISKFIQTKDWSVPMQLPSGSNIHLIALPGEQVFLMGSIPKGLSPSDQNRHVRNIVEGLVNKIDEYSEDTHRNIKISFTAGCNLLHDSDDFSDSFRQSQVALLTAQQLNKKWAVYTPDQDEKIINQVTLMGELETAIKQDQLEIYIQPQFLLKGQKLDGGEILLRWHHPAKGYISPHVFIPLSEKSGLVFSITKFVIDNTCKWLSQLKKDYPLFYNTFEVSINLSALDMAQDQLISHLQNSIFYHDIDSSKIILEVTESAVLNNADLFLETIRKLKLLGFRISIDDFGTGYSSMQYLQTMKADEIKIDMAFIRGIDHNLTSQNIAKAIIQLAHSTGAKTVAEGIQSEKEMHCLQSLDCTKAQGFYWTPAIPLGQFVQEHIKKH
jgi:EAL domain-containing protein (putative c-di-GMP-specific phosphodiesterase class I)